ncbi:uncharacterized protein [Amphiura filiformis]|uniref:uncharacterized protein n=1 Tax=Amphiura filiformis TaxID=82378 RepID=UPI003B228520
MPRPSGVDSSNTSTAASKTRISLRADIDKLMDYFLLTESVRYQEFARVWQALNFSLIYVGLKDNKDKKEFIQDAFELVSEYLQPPFDLQRRVCALYTLYGLFYTQTHHPRIKIRMSLEDWKETLALHDDLQEQGHLDALYVFHKMRLDKAFMFTATHTPMFYQGRTRKPEDFEKWAAKHQSFMASVLDEDLLQELEQVHKSYDNDKQTLNLQEDASLTIVKDSMSEYVMERISNIDVPREAEEPEALTESRSRASRIREIKKRSFISPTRGSKARRSRVSGSETDGDPTYSPTVVNTNRKGKRRKSRGSRGRPRKSDSDASLSSPVRKKRQGTPDAGESDMSLSSPSRKKRKETSSDASPNLEDEGSGKKSKRRMKESLDKSKNDKSLEPVEETDEVVDQNVDKDSTSEKKVSKKSKDGKKHKQKSPVKSGKKKKTSKNKKSSTKRTPKSSKDKEKVSKKTQSKKTPKDKPERSPKNPTNSKESSPESKDTVKIKVETPTKESETVNESPRKRPRKSNTPRRLTRSQDGSSS